MNLDNVALIRKNEVLRRTGIGASSTLYYLIKKGEFPKPVKLGKRTSAWYEQEVLDWIRSRPRLGEE